MNCMDKWATVITNDTNNIQAWLVPINMNLVFDMFKVNLLAQSHSEAIEFQPHSKHDVYLRSTTKVHSCVVHT